MEMKETFRIICSRFSERRSVKELYEILILPGEIVINSARLTLGEIDTPKSIGSLFCYIQVDISS